MDCAQVWEREGKDGSSKELTWDGWRVMDLFIDVFFLCDVVTNFVTGYYKSTDQVPLRVATPRKAKQQLLLCRPSRSCPPASGRPCHFGAWT